MLPPHEALLAAPLLSSCSMQPGSILIMHGSATDVQLRIIVRRWHVESMAWSSIVPLLAPTVRVRVSILLTVAGHAGAFEKCYFREWPSDGR